MRAAEEAAPAADPPAQQQQPTVTAAAEQQPIITDEAAAAEQRTETAAAEQQSAEEAAEDDEEHEPSPRLRERLARMVGRIASFQMEPLFTGLRRSTPQRHPPAPRYTASRARGAMRRLARRRSSSPSK